MRRGEFSLRAFGERALHVAEAVSDVSRVDTPEWDPPVGAIGRQCARSDLQVIGKLLRGYRLFNVAIIHATKDNTTSLQEKETSCKFVVDTALVVCAALSSET